MSRDSQKRKILRFLKGKGRKDIDAFCIYQWIDRCHFHGWWDLGVALGPSVPPNSLDEHYHKRLDFLLGECRSKFEALKKEFIELKNPGAKKGFLIPKSFWITCTDLGIKLGGRSNSGLRLEFLGKKILYVARIGTNTCVFRFFDMDSDRLNSWLNSHGFGHLVEGIIWPKNASQTKKACLKVSWTDATNLIPSIIEEAKSDVFVLWEGLLQAVREIKDCTWGMYLDFIKDKYSIVLPDSKLETVRKFFVHVCNAAGNEHLAKRLSIQAQQATKQGVEQNK